MDRKNIINELVAMEMRMVEAPNLFADIADRMQERSVGILGFPVTRSQLKAMTALAEDSLIGMGSLCSMAKVKMPSLNELVDLFEKQGILTRVRDDGDRRVVRVCFTMINADYKELLTTLISFSQPFQQFVVNTILGIQQECVVKVLSIYAVNTENPLIVYSMLG